MQWVFLIGENPFTLNSISKIKFKDSPEIRKCDEQLEIRYKNNDYAIFYKECNADDMRSDFEPLDFKEYLQKLPFEDPRWIMLKYNKVLTLKRIISEDGFPADVIIDCDGVDLGLKEVFDESRIIET